MHSSSNWKNMEQEYPRTVNMFKSGRPNSHAVVCCKCLGSSRRCSRVQGCTPQCCLGAQPVQMGEEPQQGVMENCPGCLSSLCEHKDTNILPGISIYILFVACFFFFFFLGCSRQHICSSLDTAFRITITVPGNF